MTIERHLTKDARLENLKELRDFVVETCQECGGDAEVCDSLELAVDEACTNVVLHGYDGLEPGPIALSFTCDGREAVVTIADHGRPFSLDDIPAPDLDGPWETRRIGGLGWYLIRKTMDGIELQAGADRGNRLTLRKRLHPDV